MTRSIRAVAVATAALLLAMALFAIAYAAFFHSASSSVNNAGALVVNFDERGLGNGDVTYLLTANAQAEYWCVNGGGKNPSAANKRTVESDLSTGGSFEVKNGRVVASLTAGPLSAGDFSCPNGQRLRLASVSYTNILLQDLTNGVSIAVANASRTFLP